MEVAEHRLLVAEAQSLPLRRKGPAQCRAVEAEARPQVVAAVLALLVEDRLLPLCREEADHCRLVVEVAEARPQ